jgi:hypothetical protein
MFMDLRRYCGICGDGKKYLPVVEYEDLEQIEGGAGNEGAPSDHFLPC